MQQPNIKSKEAYQLACEFSRITSENITRAVIRAVKERLKRLHAPRRSGSQGIASQLLAIGDQCV